MVNRSLYVRVGFLCVFGWLLLACQHDPIVAAQPPVPELPACNPDTVYYEKDIQPLLAAACASSGCHDVVTQVRGLALIDYAHTMANDAIIPFDPNNSVIYKSLISNIDRMPPDAGPYWTANQVAAVKKWIEQGALDNNCNADLAVCDSTQVSYQTFVQPLIATRCGGCHYYENPGGGILLVNYKTIKDVALNGKLFGSVSHATGYISMPQVGNALSACEVAKLKTWISEGAPQN